PDLAYTFTYDELDRWKTQAGPFGVTLTNTFDAVGNRTKLEDSSGGVMTMTYNAVNLRTRTDFTGNGGTLRFDQDYDARNALTTIDRYSDLAGTTKIGDTQQSYDDVGRLKNIKHRDGSGTSLLNITYTYDLASQ